VTITGLDGKKYYDDFLNNYEASGFEWVGGKDGTAFYDNPLINTKILQTEVMTDDRR